MSLQKQLAVPQSSNQTETGRQRIIICDELHSAALEILQESGFEPEVRLGMSEAQLIEAVPGAEALIVRSATKITRAVIEAADQLAVVGRAGVGVDNVDVNAATSAGVVVMNTPTGNTTTTGELAVALMCSIARHIPRADRTTRTGSWKKKGLMGTEITGKTLGVIGLGRIGRVVAARALGLEMDVIAYDPYLSKLGADPGIEGVELVELEELLERSDFVTLHVPLTDSTRNLLSRERIAAMKPGVRIINCARGGLIDEEALAEALEEGQVAGAALDVLRDEPPGQDHPLMGREDVILTPHLGASSHEAQRNVAVDVAQQIAAFFQDEVAHNAVNAPALPAATRKDLAPYLLLSERIGTYLAQRMQEPIRKIEFTLAGDISRRDKVGALKLSLLVACLKQSMDLGVNFVNAPSLAQERGIRVLEGEAEDADSYQNIIKVRVSSKGGERSHLVSGTVFGNDPRFVRIDGMRVDLAPVGHMMITRHTDQPGVLGAIGKVLGDSGVNIRRVEVGPGSAQSEGHAAAFLSLYSEPTEEVIAAIRELPDIHGVQCVDLGER